MTQTDLWPRIEPLLRSVDRPSRYIGSEWGAAAIAPDEYPVGLCYPGTYEVGQANQGIQILYEILNDLPGIGCERVYLPWIDMIEAMRTERVPLFTLETFRPVRELAVFGITLPYELSYTTILEVLDLAGLPVFSSERGEDDPLVVGGGPCVYNPEPMHAFFDVFLIGEGEEALPRLITTYRDARNHGATKKEALIELAQQPGIYVPRFFSEVARREGAGSSVVALDSVPATVTKTVTSDFAHLPASRHPIVPFMEVVHDRYAVEILRGCTRGCRFCQAGMTYRPVRERAADSVVRETLAGIANTGYDEASLTSLSSADHSQIEEILRRLLTAFEGTGVGVSLPSLRVDAFSVALARLMAGGGRKSGLTFAPEAGSQRLRDVINKNVTEEDLLATVHEAFEAGWTRVKLYFMIGLPTETDEDIAAIGALTARVLATARAAVAPRMKGAVTIGVSVSTFVPKAHTPFQWEPQVTEEEIFRKQEVLRSSMPRKGVNLSWHDARTSFLEGVIARGDRDLAAVIYAAWRKGSRFDAWSEEFDESRWTAAFEECAYDPIRIANRRRAFNEPLPWGHIHTGVSDAFLKREALRAREERTTPDCSFVGCTGCDACQNLGSAITLGGERR